MSDSRQTKVFSVYQNGSHVGHFNLNPEHSDVDYRDFEEFLVELFDEGDLVPSMVDNAKTKMALVVPAAPGKARSTVVAWFWSKDKDHGEILEAHAAGNSLVIKETAYEGSYADQDSAAVSSVLAKKRER